MPLDEFVSRPSKGIRQNLVKIGFESFADEQSEAVKELSGVIESLHNASLIVDDIQDNSKVRRNAPSMHQSHGVAKAINASNWLYFYALKKLSTLQVSSETKQRLNDAILDMLFEGHFGQALDLGRSVDQIPKEEIMHLSYSCMQLKTGALTGMALSSGAILAGADALSTHELKRLGLEFGVLLQKLDDIKNLKWRDEEKQNLDVEKQLEDFFNQRPNYLWVFAAKFTDDLQFVRLKKAIQALPDLTQLSDWLQQNEFHKQAKKYWDADRQVYLSRCRTFTKEKKLKIQLDEKLDHLLRKLEAAYESI